MNASSLSFQDIILRLQQYWGEQGCVIMQPYDSEVGAGTFHTATTLRSLGPAEWRTCYAQPCRRPADGRYGENPNRMQHYYQFQVVIKPSPDNIQELYLGSLKELGMRVQAAREHTMKLCGTEPTLSQLAEQLGESVENVAMAIQAAQPAMSLTPEGREDAEHQLDIPVESPEEELADRISLAEVIEALPEQDKQLIRLRFYGNRTQSETAKALHTTQVQISRRERKILVLLRRRLLEE